MNPGFQQIIEANLEELLDYRPACPVMEPLNALYIDVLTNFLQGDTDGLVLAISRIAEPGALEEGEEKKILLGISTLRLQIRRHEVDRALITSLEQHLENQKIEFQTKWAGELFFVIGKAYEILHNHPLSKKYYGLSCHALGRAGALKKSLKAKLNYLACESRIFPEKKLFADYQFIYRQARALGESTVAGIALLNISREYQRVGAFSVALKYCNRAVALHRRDLGSVSYFLAIVHRSHLHFEMGRAHEAELDCEYAQLSGFSEVQGALQVLDGFRGRAPAKPEMTSTLTPTWQERMDEASQGKQQGPMSELESRLVQLLSTGPKTKFELVAALYGEGVAFFSAENRLKNLLNRVRKRRPHLVIFSEEKYRISDEVFLDGQGGF